MLEKQFEVETDHKSLVTVLGEKDLSSLPVRVQRFKMRLIRFDYHILYNPGNKMYVADSLSRPNEIGYNEMHMLSCIDVEQYVSAIDSFPAFENP